MTRALLLLAAPLLLLAGCGDAGGEGATEETSATSAVPVPAVPVPAVLTEEHDGGRFALPVGAEVPLQLSSRWSWEVEAEGVALTPVDHLTDPGYQEWLLTATAPGEATVTAYGSPGCGDQGDCPERTVVLRLTVTD